MFKTTCTNKEQIQTVNRQSLIFCAKKLGHWMGGWMGGCWSRVKDCLQQSKIIQKCLCCFINFKRFKVFYYFFRIMQQSFSSRNTRVVRNLMCLPRLCSQLEIVKGMQLSFFGLLLTLANTTC